MAKNNSEVTLDVVNRFNKATSHHDVDGMMDLMSENVVFESTGPAPDGQKIEGQTAVRKVWEELFQSTPEAKFTAEELFASNDRCVVRWSYDFGKGHIRGVDIIRVENGKIAEKLSYVKGRNWLTLWYDFQAGTSLSSKNVRLLCMKHSLQKSAKIE